MKLFFRTATCAFIVACATVLASCGNRPNETEENEAQKLIEDEVVTTADDILFSFAFVGCNRVERGDTKNPNTNASTANLPELQRTFTEISNLNPKPAFLFFVGDMVLGLDTTPNVLSKELKAWVKQYYDTTFSPISTSGIKLVAVPGNHEALFYNAPTGSELPWSKALSIWMKEMGAFMPTQPLNRVGGKDSMLNLQTYSFNYGNTHFIMLNTDTYNKAEHEGLLPAGWVAADIQKARKDTTVKHIFLLGHKPSYVFGAMDGPHETMADSITNIIWPAMENNQVEAMLSAHSHLYYRYQPHPGKSYQVIAGNGGSKYEHGLDSAHQFMGYSVVSVMKSGKVVVKSMGRTVYKDSYLAPLTAAQPTTVRDSVEITWGSTAPFWQSGVKQ